MATPQEVQHLLSALREELSSSFQREIVRLDHQTTTLQAELRGLTTAITSRPSRPRPRLPDPVKFTGHAGDFDSWLLEMDGKMAVDADAIGDDQAQFRYWFSRLDSKPQKVVASHVRHAESTGNWDYRTTMRSTLMRINDDPLKQRKAAAQLRDLKQGDFGLHSFLAKWETLAGESGHATMDDQVRIAALRHAVNHKLQQKLEDREVQFGSLPTTYDDFVALLHKINSGVPTGYHNQKTTGTGTGTGPRPTTNNPDAMDIGAIDHSHIHAVNQFGITAQQRRKWYHEGKCRGCGSEDHKLKACPSNSAKLAVAILEEEGRVDEEMNEMGLTVDLDVVDEVDDEGDYSDYDY